MQPLPLSREEQYELLEQNKVAELAREYLSGDISRIGEIITLTQEEYAAWDLTKPLREGGWIKKSPDTQDGVYFLNKGESWWTVYQQDRGAIIWKENFTSYEEARRYLAIDYGLGRFLRSQQTIKGNVDKLAEASKSNASSSKSSIGKAVKKWWKFW